MKYIKTIVRMGIILSVLFMFKNTCIAQDTIPHPSKKLAFKGYLGGMMYHTGYVQSNNFSINNPETGDSFTTRAKGMPSGLGGTIKFQFGNHLRIGGEGYSSKLKYNKNGSYNHTGWGGILAEGVYPVGRFNLFAGVTIGGGSTTNVTMYESYNNDFSSQEAAFRKFGFMVTTPYLGTEFSLTKKIRLVFKVDYLFNVSNPQPDFVSGPRFYLGILFARIK